MNISFNTMQFELMDPGRFQLSGHKELDEQQTEFIAKGNLFLKAYNKEMAEKTIEPTVTFLSDYTKVHFLTQEAIMALHSYPGLSKHAEHHNEYVREIAKGFKMLLEYKSIGSHEMYEKLSTQVAMIITDWFEFHMLQADTRLNQFIKYELKHNV